MKELVTMQVFLVDNPVIGRKLDFAGFMAGYTLFFGTEDQPNLPARLVVRVAGLANPGLSVAIEANAVRP